MKKENRQLMIITLFVVLIFGFIFGIPALYQSKNQACTEEAKVCADGTVVARTEPNCEFAPCPDIDDNRVYCTPNQRLADACIEIYQPVCGYSDPEQIQCFKAPCATKYSNSCFACMDETVLYWVDGICE
jgi:hypothetical protein